MKKLKLYIETSVWHFPFLGYTPEMQKVTQEFFDLVKQKVFDTYISDVVLREINRAPEEIRTKLIDLIKQCEPMSLETTDDARELTKRYLDKKIVPEKKQDDALHVGIATVAEVDALVTWNYKHLANLRKAELFHSVNIEIGYVKKVEIVTPMEVLSE